MSDKLNIRLQFFADPPTPDPPGPEPILDIVVVHSNDGATLLGSVLAMTTVDPFTGQPKFLYPALFNPNDIHATVDHLLIACNFYGSPYDTGFDLSDYAGISDSPNATEPDEKYATNNYYFGAGEYHVYVVPKGGGGNTLDVTYNGAKIIDSLEVTPPVAVTYNGSTIATLNAGDSKTLQCNGKVMQSDVVIGDKTLQCNGKLMASDVVVEVGG